MKNKSNNLMQLFTFGLCEVYLGCAWLLSANVGWIVKLGKRLYLSRTSSTNHVQSGNCTKKKQDAWKPYADDWTNEEKGERKHGDPRQVMEHTLYKSRLPEAKQTEQAGESYNSLDFVNATFFCFILKQFSLKEYPFILICRRRTTH